MIRKILLFLLLAVFGGLVFFMYTRFNENKRTTEDYFAAVPYQAAMVYDIKNPKQFFQSISTTNLIYDELKQIGWTKKIDTRLKKLDSLISSDLFFDLRWEKTRLVASLVPTGKDKHSWLFSVLIPNQVSNKELKNKVNKLFGQGALNQEEKYDGSTIQTYTSKENETWFVSIYENYLLVSDAQMGIEDAVRQINSDISLKVDDAGFKKVYATAGQSKDINLYINQKYFSQFLSKYVEQNGKNAFSRLESFAGWTELDIIAKSNGILLNGYSHAIDSMGGFLTVFDNQTSQNIDVLDVLPASTSFLLHYGISDYKSYDVAYQNYLMVRNKLNSRNQALETLKSAGVNTSELLAKHMVGEVAMCISEVQTDIKGQGIGAIQSKTFGLIRIINKTAFLESMRPLLGSDGEADSLTTYRDVEIYAMRYRGFMRQAFGRPFEAVACNYLMFANNYVVFGDQLAAMRDFINNWKGNKTLASDEHFEGFKENLSDQSNITLYSNIARSPKLLHYFLKGSYADSIENNLDFFRKFGGVSLQIEKGKNNLYYNSIYLKHNPSYKKISSSLWEVPLDTILASIPMPFTNHYTKAKDILVQDAKGKIYLISNTGRVLWSRALGASIMGKVHEIDRYKNEKYQLLFNTKDNLYMLDRNGKNVEGYPVKFKTEICQPISVFDYDNNRKYRIFAPQSNGAIQCFNIAGKIVNGWNFKKSKPLIKPLLYSKINKKDYLIGLQENGAVKVVNRKGEPRLKLKRKLETFQNSSFSIDKGKDLSSTYIICSDSNGVVYRLSLKDKLETAQLKQTEGLDAFDLLDINFDGKLDYCFTDKNSLKVYNSEFKLIWEYEAKSNILPSLKVYQEKGESTGFISFSDANSAAYIFDGNQNPREGSPFYGLDAALISDVNIDGRFELVIGSKEGSVYCYILN